MAAPGQFDPNRLIRGVNPGQKLEPRRVAYATGPTMNDTASQHDQGSLQDGSSSCHQGDVQFIQALSRLQSVRTQNVDSHQIPDINLTTHDYPHLRPAMSTPAHVLPSASIRVYDHEQDFKLVRYLIGASILSKTGSANACLFWSNPLVYVWAITFSVYVPLRHIISATDETGVLKTAAIKTMIRLPVFVGPPLVLLVLLNWCHRIYFGSVMRKALFSEDVKHPGTYYGSSSTLGKRMGGPTIWVLEYDRRPLGVVAVTDDVGDDSTSISSAKKGKELLPSDLGPRTIRIQHLATSLPFRRAGIDHELVSHAVNICLAQDHSVERVVISLVPGLDDAQIEAVEQAGFRCSLSAQAYPSSSWSWCQTWVRRMVGWPDCERQWIDDLWVCERS